MPVITVAIHKGGTGKTTCAIHNVFDLDQRGHTVCLIDCDTQGNATSAFCERADGHAGACSLFTKEFNLDLLFKSDYGNGGISVVPADPELVGVERLPLGTEQTFRDNVRALAGDFDYVVIDTPPTMGFAMLAPLIASDFAYSPIVSDPCAIQGVSSLFQRIEAVTGDYNEDLVFLGLLVNRWNRRNRLQTDAVTELKAALPEHLIPHEIAERSAIAQLAYTNEPVWKMRNGAARVAAKEMRGTLSWIYDKTIWN